MAASIILVPISFSLILILFASQRLCANFFYFHFFIPLSFQSMAIPKIDPALHQERKPDWIKVRLPSNPVFFSTKAMIADLRLHTVCESAQCPNRWECWSGGTATMMIAGDRCTRACGFCAVDTAKPFALEEDEPERVAEAVRRMKLKHVVVTAVARDDVHLGGDSGRLDEVEHAAAITTFAASTIDSISPNSTSTTTTASVKAACPSSIAASITLPSRAIGASHLSCATTVTASPARASRGRSRV
jgi:lipoate synthase